MTETNTTVLYEQLGVEKSATQVVARASEHGSTGV